ncbi:MAG: DUF3311 domain-containing protein [Candidatus Eisenbacteria bacterium]
MRRAPWHRWLAVIPALLILVGAPFANRVHALVLGLPFLLFWIVGCVLLTSVTMAVVGALDARHEATSPPPSGKSRAR